MDAHMLPRRYRWLAVLSVVGLIGTAATGAPARLTSASSIHAVVNASHPCLVFTGSGDTTFTRNFNPYATGTWRDLTLGGVYEPLFIHTAAGGGHTYPWLATKYRWSKNGKTLFITIRSGVKWSDGQPFTAKDVLFTFTAGKINKVMDQIGYVAPNSHIARIYLAGKNAVAVQLKKRDITWTDNITGFQWIVPAHIWSKIKDPTKFTNPNPVGTGPFTRVLKFSSQSYTMGKNSHYWQKGKPMVSCITRVYSSGNDASLLMLDNGDIDWGGVFVPNVQKVYASRDPAHFHYFYPLDAMPTAMQYDDARYPWSLKGFRQAVSMALDRKRIVTIGEYGTSAPSDALGLNYMYPKWVDSKVDAAGKKYVTYNPAAAKALLEKLHFTYKGSTLIDPHGNPVTIPLDVPNGWNDYILSLQIVSQNLKAIGIGSSLKLEADVSSFSQRSYKGFAAYFNYTCAGGATPITYFVSNLSKQKYTPSGQDATATCNFPHYYDPKADPLINSFYGQLNKAKQHAIISKLEALMLKDFPFIPVMVQPVAFEYSTRYYTGFPNKNNFYANGPYWVYPDITKVLTMVRPVK